MHNGKSKRHPTDPSMDNVQLLMPNPQRDNICLPAQGDDERCHCYGHYGRPERDRQRAVSVVRAVVWSLEEGEEGEIESGEEEG